MIIVRTFSNFLRKDWIPQGAVDLLNGKPEIPFVWLDEKLVTKYGARGRKIADGEFVRWFRMLIDAWIDSGKGSDGVDEPAKRKLSAVVPGSDYPFHGVLSVWVQKNWRFGVSVAGEIVSAEPPLYFPRAKAALFGRENAFYWFVHLLDSGGARRIGKCDAPDCGRYFLRQRLHKMPIKRGSYCDACSGSASAVRTQISRTMRQRSRIEAAAEAWTRWKQPRHGKRSEWVANQVNAKSDGVPITGKWVTQHQREIEIEVKRRQDGKS